MYDIQLVCVLKWNKRDSFQKKKTPIYCSMLFNLCAYLKWNKRAGFQKNPIDENMLLNLCAKWNKRGSLQKTTIYYCMLFNLCAYWNETRGIVFKKKTHKFITLCYSTCVHIEIKQDGQISKKSNWWQYATELVCEMNREGQFSKNTQIITVCYSTCVCIEMKQEGQFSKKTKKNKKKTKTPIYYSMLFNLCAYWNQTRWTVFKKIRLMTICYWTHVRNETRGTVFQKHTNYYCMLFNLCAYWNETRGTVFKKKHQFITVCSSTRGAVFKKQQFITVCYSTCVRIEMKQEGQFSKNTQIITVCYSTCVCIEMKQEGQFSKKTKQKKNTNLLQYAIQPMCILKSNKMDRFQKNPIDDNMLLNSCAEWNNRGSFPKTTIYYCMLFNLCAYWNETRGIVFKKKTPIYYIMLFNLCAYWNQTRWTDFKKIQLMTICYWTHVRNETRGAVFQKHTNYYCMLFNLCAYWNETRGTVFKKI